MIRRFARMLGLLLALCALPALALTSAWLDRAQISYGETATLNIETDQSVQQIDYRALEGQFDIAGQTVRRSYRRSADGIPLLWLVSARAEHNDDATTAYTQVFIVRDRTAYPWIVETVITDDLPEMTPLTTSVR